MGQSQNRTAALAAARWSVLRLIPLSYLLAGVTLAGAQAVAGSISPVEAQALVNRALSNELRAAQDSSHPMRYTLHKISPRLTSTKQIVETKDGEVARLTSVFDKPLSAAAEQQEETRLYALLRNPGLQHHRKQSEDADTARALKVLRALPYAFTYQYAGPADSPSDTLQKFTFKPNPDFSAPDLETTALSQMSGQILIDPARERVTRLEGHLDQDVDFGWGILGRLNKGGWITIDQADVGGNQWRTVHFQMAMSGRVVLKTRVFDTTEDESGFTPVPQGMGYQQAIQMLQSDAPAKAAGK
ncbi:MAG: hypothetical protein ACLQHF_01330 [Terracidiphilus sp.]